MFFILNGNRQANGDYEVHNKSQGCHYMPLANNQIPLGEFPSCREAVAYAKLKYNSARINGCAYCCAPCHTT